jgi:SAM-dependent methyltransferase
MAAGSSRSCHCRVGYLCDLRVCEYTTMPCLRCGTSRVCTSDNVSDAGVLVLPGRSLSSCVVAHIRAACHQRIIASDTYAYRRSLHNFSSVFNRMFNHFKSSVRMADLMDIYNALLIDAGYIDGLAAFLTTRAVRTILDCGSGTGFPALDLRARGWDICGVDRSARMLKRLSKKLYATDLTMPLYQTDWLNLTACVPDTFDALLCRGNSLIYIDSWDSETLNDGTPTRILQALGQFRAKIHAGGMLYIDLYHRRFDDGESKFICQSVAKMIGDQHVRLDSTIHYDYGVRRRAWNWAIEIDGQQATGNVSSYLLRHADLIDMLYAAGFTHVEEVQISGEVHLTGYVASVV